MLPTSWSYSTNKVTPSSIINWESSEMTFQASCCFPYPRHNYLPYFEIFVVSMPDSASLTCIGVGKENMKGRAILPGGKDESFGYDSKGNLAFEAKRGNSYGPSFGQGDVVGCGITIKNELYFTKNGTSLGIVCNLNGHKYFPVLGLNKASVSTNFGNFPFLFDPFNRNNLSMSGQLLGPRSITLSSGGPRLFLLGEALLNKILLCLDAKHVLLFAQTCKRNYRTAIQNQIWKSLVLAKWPSMEFDSTIASCYQLYKKRTAKEAHQ